MSTTINHAERPAVGFIRQADLVPGMVPFSPATLWRKVKSGEFPQPVKLSARVTAWRLEDVHAWMQSRTSAGGA
jgi:predicted DNA-binding transcriptional regulator AlpA